MRAANAFLMATRGASALFDPSTMPLTGWWRGSYSASPWAGIASAGTSGGRSMTTATGTGAGVGTSLNGHAAASFDGAGALRDAVNTTENYLSTTAYRVSLLLYVASASSPAANIYDNPGILTENGGNWGIVVNTSGVHCFHAASGYKVASQAITTDEWQAVDVVYDGSHITVSVDGVGGTPVAAGTLATITGSQFRFGINYATAFFEGEIMDAAVADTALSSTSSADWKGYYNARYALSL